MHFVLLQSLDTSVFELDNCKSNSVFAHTGRRRVTKVMQLTKKTKEIKDVVRFGTTMECVFV